MGATVGRDAELAAITSFLRGGVGRSAVLVLEGAPGIGKTTLWEESARAASAAGFRVLAARPLPVEGQISYSAVDDLLAGVLEEVLERLPAPQRQALQSALLIVEPGDRPPEPQAIAFAFLSALRALALAAPTLVAVDDFQWLDDASAALISYAARRLRDDRIRLIFATRTGDRHTFSESSSPWPDGIAAERLSIGPLSSGAIQRMVREQLGQGLTRPMLRRIYEVSGGNPFHAIELARTLAQRDSDLDPGEPLPFSTALRDLVGSRLQPLPDATRRALEIAALSAKPTLTLVERAMGEPENLEPAVTAEVVSLAGNRVLFSHPLFASWIVEQMSFRTRLDAHRRLAELAADREERAHHLALASTEPDAAVAAELERAAAGATARGAPSIGAGLLEHSLRLTPAGTAIVRRTIDAATAHFEGGDTGSALALLESLASELSPGRERAEVLYRLAIVHAELDFDATISVALYERALAEPELEPLIESRIRSDLAWLAIFVADLSYGRAQAQTAVTLSEALDSPAALAEATTALAFVETLAGTDARPVLDGALALEESGHRFRIDRSPTVVTGIQLLYGGELNEARIRFESLRQLAADRGEETNLSIGLYYLALLALQRGEFQQADEHVREGIQLADDTGVNVLETRFIGALLDAHLGNEAAAEAAATTLLSAADSAHDRMTAVRALSVMGFLELSRGRGLEAHAHLVRALERSDEIGIGEPFLLRFVADDVEALVSLRRLGEAQSTLARFERPARHAGQSWTLAMVDRCRGLIRAAADDLAGGLEDLERARHAFEQLPFEFEAARTLIALGTAQRRAKHRGQARASLGAALAIFERLPAPLWAEKARSELSRIGGRRCAGEELTPQERLIAEMVAGGGTNREVAAALFVTVNTVEGALTRVYRKLDVRSRTELANRVRAAPKL